MNYSIHLVSLVIMSILLSIHNVLGSPPKIRAKRLSNSQSDMNNVFKHEVRLTNKDGFCSGTIISDIHVLTAAHCVILKGTSDLVGGAMEVTVGITMVGNAYEFQTVRLVEVIYIPNNFSRAHNTNDNLRNMLGDIAVLKLNYRLGLGNDPRIEPLNAPTHQYLQDESSQNSVRSYIMFTGFGGTKAVFNSKINDHVPGEFPVYLQFSKAEVLPSSSCPLLGNAETKMCAKLVNPDAGICGGDSGGALIDLETKTVLGVLSYGAKMCNQATPAVYTRVFPYLGFIKNALMDVPHEIMRRESLTENPEYQKAWTENMYKYHWIYAPGLHGPPTF